MTEPARPDFFVIVDALQSLVDNAVKVADVASKIEQKNPRIKEVIRLLASIKQQLSNLQRGES